MDIVYYYIHRVVWIKTDIGKILLEDRTGDPQYEMYCELMDVLKSMNADKIYKNKLEKLKQQCPQCLSRFERDGPASELGPLMHVLEHIPRQIEKWGTHTHTQTYT